MRKFLITLFCFVCVLSGCGFSKPPPHIEIPQYPGAMVTIGTAMYSPSTRMMRSQAEQDGREGMARLISTRVQQLIENWGEQNQSSLSDKVVFTDYFKTVGKAIVDQELVGARVAETYFDEKTNSQYAVIVYKKADAVKLAQEKMKSVRKKFDEQENQKAEERMFISSEKAEQAFVELDALIEEQLGQQSRKTEA